MAETEPVKRVLQMRLRAIGDPAQVLALIRSSAPFYRSLGWGPFRLLQNVDDPAQIVVEIEYQADAALELNRHKIAADPMVRNFLQGWRTILAGSAEMDVCGRPLGCKQNLWLVRGMWSGADVCPASICGYRAPRALMEVCGSGPVRLRALDAPSISLVLPTPSS
jgi:hypothetical protein